MFCVLGYLYQYWQEKAFIICYYVMLQIDSYISQYIFYWYKERESAFIQLRNARSNKAESRWNGQIGGGGEGREEIARMVGCRCLQSVYINRTTDSRSTADARAVSYMTDKDEAHQFPIQFAGPVFRTLYLLSCKMRLTGSLVLRELRSIPLRKSSLTYALFNCVVTLRCVALLTNAIFVLQRNINNHCFFINNCT